MIKTFKKQVFCAAVFFIAALCLILFVAQPAYAASYSIKTFADSTNGATVAEGLTKSDITLDTSKISLNDPYEFQTSNSNIKRSDTISGLKATVCGFPKSEDSRAAWKSIVLSGLTISDTSQYKDKQLLVKDSSGAASWFSLKWSNVGFDKEGDAVDLTLKVSNIYVGYSSKYKAGHSNKDGYCDFSKQKYFSLMNSLNGSLISTSSYSSGDFFKAYFTATLTKHGTSAAAKGSYIFSVKDLDAGKNTSYSGMPYREHCILKSGFASPVFISKNSHLLTSDGSTTLLSLKNAGKTSDGSFYSDGVSDNNSYLTGFQVRTTGNVTGFELGGFSCSTDIFDIQTNSFNPLAKAVVYTDGKKSEAGGTGNWTYQSPFSNKNYQLTLTPGYRISKVYAGYPSTFADFQTDVEGSLTDITSKFIAGYNSKTNSYQFDSSHNFNKIIVYLEPCTLTVRYHFNADGAGPAAGDGTFAAGDPCKVSVYKPSVFVPYGFIDASRAEYDLHTVMDYYTETPEDTGEMILWKNEKYADDYTALQWAKEVLAGKYGLDADFSNENKTIDVYMQWQPVKPEKCSAKLPLTGGTDWQTPVSIALGFTALGLFVRNRRKAHDGFSLTPRQAVEVDLNLK